jgi:hypothetical protein
VGDGDSLGVGSLDKEIGADVMEEDEAGDIVEEPIGGVELTIGWAGEVDGKEEGDWGGVESGILGVGLDTEGADVDGDIDGAVFGRERDEDDGEEDDENVGLEDEVVGETVELGIEAGIGVPNPPKSCSRSFHQESIVWIQVLWHRGESLPFDLKSTTLKFQSKFNQDLQPIPNYSNPIE